MESAILPTTALRSALAGPQWRASFYSWRFS
jgi:hypothetical protein